MLLPPFSHPHFRSKLSTSVSVGLDASADLPSALASKALFVVDMVAIVYGTMPMVKNAARLYKIEAFGRAMRCKGVPDLTDHAR